MCTLTQYDYITVIAPLIAPLVTNRKEATKYLADKHLEVNNSDKNHLPTLPLAFIKQ